MSLYTIQQLKELGIISPKLKSVLGILGCNTSEDILELSKDSIKVEYIGKSYKLKDELLRVVKDITDSNGMLSEVMHENTNVGTNSKVAEEIKSSAKFTVCDYTEDLLMALEHPVKIEVLVMKLREYLPNTYAGSVKANLCGDPRKRFVFFLDGMVGLKDKVYDKRYQVFSVANKKRQYAEQRIMEYVTFVEEKHRSPQPHGLDEEESLYRWSQDFTKSTAKEMEDLRLTFNEYLKEYDKWIYSSFEYSYKRNCDMVKWYVDENVELPNPDEEPELSSWFNSQLECHKKYKDKRKQMFLELLSYLADYGMHFYDSKTLKGKAAITEQLKVEEKLEETDLERFSRYLSNLRNKTNLNELAVHKALLLITVANGVQTGKIESNVIYLDDNLLMEFADVCMEYMGTASSYNIAFPFLFMNNEPFWTLLPKEGISYSEIEAISVPTFDVVENCISCAIIDDSLFNLLQSVTSYAVLKDIIVSKYINKKAKTTQSQFVGNHISNNYQLESLPETAMVAEAIDIPEKKKDEENQKSTRGPVKKFEVHLDGKVVDGKDVAGILAETIKRIGFERVAALNIMFAKGKYNLADRRKRTDGNNRWQREIDGWYIYANTNTLTKADNLAKIAQRLNLDMEIIVDGKTYYRSQRKSTEG